jgi:tetratricopeptide (TPR) repeat protein
MVQKSSIPNSILGQTQSKQYHGLLAALCVLLLFACTDTPQTPAEHLAQGDQFLADGNTAEAVASYRLALHQDTLNPVILARLSKAYRAQKKTVAAERYLRRAMNIPYEEGISALQMGDDSTAVSAFELTLDIFPQHPLALNKLGDIYLARGLESKALLHYEKSSEANPRFAETWVKLGRLYTSLGQVEKAKRAYLNAIAQNLNSYRSYLGLGQIYLDETLWMDAAEQFDKALLVDPYSAAARAGINEARSHL